LAISISPSIPKKTKIMKSNITHIVSLNGHICTLMLMITHVHNYSLKPTFHFPILLKLHMCIAKEQFGKLDHLCKCDQILDSFWRNVLVTRCTSQDNAFQMNCELSFLWTFLTWGESVFVTNIIYFNYLSHKNHILVLTKILLGYSKPNFIDIYMFWTKVTTIE